MLSVTDSLPGGRRTKGRFATRAGPSRILTGTRSPDRLGLGNLQRPPSPGGCVVVSRRTGCMAKEEALQLEGTVSEVLPSAMFRVSLDNGHTVLATIGGNLRRFRIRVLAGDRVTLEVSPYDLTRGRIVYRHKN